MRPNTKLDKFRQRLVEFCINTSLFAFSFKSASFTFTALQNDRAPFAAARAGEREFFDAAFKKRFSQHTAV